ATVPTITPPVMTAPTLEATATATLTASPVPTSTSTPPATSTPHPIRRRPAEPPRTTTVAKFPVGGGKFNSDGAGACREAACYAAQANAPGDATSTPYAAPPWSRRRSPATSLPIWRGHQSGGGGRTGSLERARQRGELLAAVDRAGMSATSVKAARKSPAAPIAPSPAAGSRPLPTGTVTFLFTDVEGSSHSWED